MTEKKQEAEKSPVVPLSAIDHAHMVFAGCGGCTMCCDGSTYTHAGVLLDELFDTAKLFPVAFTRNKDEISLQLIYTLRKGVPCPYLEMESKRCKAYDSVRPRACKTYPFNVSERPQAATAGAQITYSVVFDTRCPGVRQDQEGIPLIGEDGMLSSQITQRFIGENVLSGYRQNVLRTKKFLALVTELDLLVEERYMFGSDGQLQPAMFGSSTECSIWKISEEKLAALDAEKVMKIHENRFFNAIYTHLNSLNNLAKLVEISRMHKSSTVDLLTFKI